MSLIKCDKCGELFSDSYRECPFCAEDEEYYRGNMKKGARRMAGARKRPSIVPLLILILVLLIAAAAWYFFGDTIKNFVDGVIHKPPVEDVIPDDTGEKEDVPPTVELVMDKTMRIAPGDSKTLTVSGGTSYEWSSSDPTVATVGGSGTVVGVKEGTAIITVTDTSGVSAVCSVTVAEGADEPDDPDTPDSDTPTKPVKPDGGSSTPAKVDVSKLKFYIPAYGLSMSPTADGSYDVTMEKSKGESSFTVEIQGTSSAITWSSDNENVASVSGGKSDSGTPTATFKANGTGETTVTAKIGDATVKFLVRVR